MVPPDPAMTMKAGPNQEMPMRETEAATVIRQLWPLLEVRDIDRSVAFYRDRLGFTVVAHDAESGGRMNWCRLERGGASIMLQGPGEPNDDSAGVRGQGVCLYFICDDADAMYAELSLRGAQLDPPRVAYYGMKQLYVPEPDGYALCFESPTEHYAG
jgi:catechol 2,3-dioxygenase-like lactoylglutathione lyase family enzyme